MLHPSQPVAAPTAMPAAGPKCCASLPTCAMQAEIATTPSFPRQRLLQQEKPAKPSPFCGQTATQVFFYFLPLPEEKYLLFSFCSYGSGQSLKRSIFWKPPTDAACFPTHISYIAACADKGMQHLALVNEKLKASGITTIFISLYFVAAPFFMRYDALWHLRIQRQTELPFLAPFSSARPMKIDTYHYKIALAAVVLCLLSVPFVLLHQETANIPVLQKGKPVPTVSEGTSPMHTSLPTLKVAVGAMISPRDTEVYYQQLLRYLGEAIQANVELIQRKTYAEVNSLLIAGEIDLAFICSGPYVTGAEQHPLYLLSTPQVQGQHTYKSYLIVHKDSAIQQLNDLQGKTFAFTDPDSNTGSLVPRYWLQQKGLSPEHFFRETIFTYSHDNSIFAVAKGLVDGAAVDSLIWDFYQHNNSELTAKTRVIHKSEAYGIPPVVAASTMPQERKEAIQQALFAMHTTAQGKQILQNLLIDRFVQPQDHWYTSIRTMQQTLQQAE